MTPSRGSYTTCLAVTFILVYLLFEGNEAVLVDSKLPLSPRGNDKKSGITGKQRLNVSDVRRQSPAITVDDSVVAEVHHRRKRHTADHLINDKYSRSVKSHARKQILAKLLNLVGSSPDNPCNCGHLDQENQPDSSSRLKHRMVDLSKRLDSMAAPNFDCECDMSSLISFLIRRLTNPSENASQRHWVDPLSRYVARLSYATKIRLTHFLHEEGLRVKRNEILRKIRRRRLHMQLMQRRRMLRKDPNAAFRGKQFLSF